MQERCLETPCYDWPEDNFGSLFLSGCRYVCGDGIITPYGARGFNESLTTSHDDGEEDEDEFEDTGSGDGESDLDIPKGRKKRQTNMTDRILEPPHLCFPKDGNVVCHVYTQFSEQLAVNVTLEPSPELLIASDWCRYRLSGAVKCHQPQHDHTCKIVCDLDDPYSRSDSLLTVSQCRHTIGDPELTFWSYLILRSIADIFPTTALALLISCLAVGTRETPHFMCRPLVFGAIGFGLFPLIADIAFAVLPSELDEYFINFGSFGILSLISTLILIFNRSLPLSPVDYHLHSGTGQLTLQGAGGETAALMVILMLLGIFWSALDSYFPWFVLSASMIPCILLLYFAGSVVEYCGHSNLLITAFTFYIIRYTGLLLFTNEIWLGLLGVLEIFTIVMSWSTAILYLRHLVPRHLTVTGQALAVIAFFCLGRCLGSVVGGLLGEDSHKLSYWVHKSCTLYKVGAVTATIIASVYFIVYHCCLKPWCLKQNKYDRYRNPQVTVQGTNSNGTYTPLKVYNQDNKGPAKGEQIRY